MVHGLAARRAWQRFCFLASATSTLAAIESSPALAAIDPSLALAPTRAVHRTEAPPEPLAAGAIAVFLDGFEPGDDCRWSAAVPPEPTSCSDLFENGCETDVDCGGRTCPACGFGLDCQEDSDCQSGICYLGSCDIAYELSVTHTGGGTVTSIPAGIDCGATCSATFDAGTQVTLTATPAADALFIGWSGACGGTGPCTLTVDQTTAVSAHFGHTVEVSRVGTGTVTSTPAGIACGSTCSGVFEHGTPIILAARTTNGSNWHFSGWGGDCAGAGAFRDCTLDGNASNTSSATFLSMTHNLAFVSSTTFATNLGSFAAYDAQCNILATAAGINSAAGNAFIAWISSAASAAGARLGVTGGWTLMDGAPFSSRSVALTGNGQVFQPIDLDETGTRQSSQVVMTGTLADGTAAPNTCTNWIGAGSATSGDTAGGPEAWTRLTFPSCTTPRRIYCLMKTQAGLLTPPVQSGKRIWISNAAFAPNAVTTPDQACAADQAGALALVARTSAPASAALTPGADYVRMDGQLVGTGAQLIAAGALPSGIWQHRDGTYLAGNELVAWTGHNGDLTALGTAAGTCADWTSPAGPSGAVGLSAVDDARWWSNGTSACSAPGRYLICVEP